MLRTVKRWPIPVGKLLSDRPHSPVPVPPPVHRQWSAGSSAPWAWPAIVAVGLSPFVLTAVGLSIAAAMRPEPQPVARPIVRPQLAVAARAPTAPAQTLDPSELGEARTPPPGFRPVVQEPPAPEPIPVAVARGPKLERFGTAIDFFRSPSLACDRAAREQKLVMVLHVAGYFDDPGFT